MEARHSTDAAEAWATTHGFLERDPVLANVPITVLHQRLERAHPGRYWWVTDGAEVVAFASQSPLDRGAYVVGAR